MKIERKIVDAATLWGLAIAMGSNLNRIILYSISWWIVVLGMVSLVIMGFMAVLGMVEK